MNYFLTQVGRWSLGIVLFLSVNACAPQAIGLIQSPQTETDIAVNEQVEANRGLVEMIAPYKQQLDAQMNEVIGRAEVGLWKRGEGESPLANFVADLTKNLVADSTGLPIDLGVTNTGGLRIELSAGPIRRGDVYELMPFDNTLTVLRLTGEQLYTLYARAAVRGNIIFSGNSKVVIEGGQLKDALLNGKSIDPAGSYLVATSSYLAGGGDDVAVFPEAELVNKTPILLRDAIAATIWNKQAKGAAIEAFVDGRYVNPALKEH